MKLNSSQKEEETVWCSDYGSENYGINILIKDIQNEDIDYNFLGGYLRGRDLKLNSNTPRKRKHRLDYQSELYGRITNWTNECKPWKLDWSLRDIFNKSRIEIVKSIKLHVEECFFFGDVQDKIEIVDESGEVCEVFFSKEDCIGVYGDSPHTYICNFKLSNGKFVSIKVMTQPQEVEMIDVSLPKHSSIYIPQLGTSFSCFYSYVSSLEERSNFDEVCEVDPFEKLLVQYIFSGIYNHTDSRSFSEPLMFREKHDLLLSSKMMTSFCLHNFSPYGLIVGFKCLGVTNEVLHQKKSNEIHRVVVFETPHNIFIGVKEIEFVDSLSNTKKEIKFCFLKSGVKHDDNWEEKLDINVWKKQDWSDQYDGKYHHKGGVSYYYGNLFNETFCYFLWDIISCIRLVCNNDFEFGGHVKNNPETIDFLYNQYLNGVRHESY